ncbi:23521_t:CDS:2, partial [Gigaspora rosea]
GITCFDAILKETFKLHSYILSWSGNISALSKVMCLSGSYSETARHIYYPLQSLQEYNNYEPENLPMRYHNNYILDKSIYETGPAWTTWQFPIERLYRILISLAKFLVDKNAHRTKTSIVFEEQIFM